MKARLRRYEGVKTPRMDFQKFQKCQNLNPGTLTTHTETRNFLNFEGMSRLALLVVLLLSSLQPAFAQNNNIKKQAEQMGAALLAQDYLGFVEFTYPKVLEQMGGKQKMATSIAQQMKGMQDGGILLESISYDPPATPIKEGKELQTTITQKMVLKLQQGRILAKSTIIAISPDNGNRWYFVDAGERDNATVRQTLPNISKSLVIPKPSQPEMLK